jgi:(p)ppGpp synthase/HD superfamily hydrolase|tara:strand:- start:15 stop:527 length:513 start_codon:yes stop_codon:yes gene_type:complete
VHQLNLVDRAKQIASKVHKGKFDKKDYPYMAHILDVASRVAYLGESYEIVGLLHDAIEDADPVEFQAEVIADINVTFDYEVSEAITAMTKSVGEDYFEEYLPRLRDNKIALQVKIADASHNLSKAHLIQDTELQDKLRAKYIKVLNELGINGSALERPIVFENGQWIEVA